MAVLDNITCVGDIKKLSVSEIKDLCGELRRKIIETTTSNGGHLSSNLGIVETTVALYYVFDFPTDKLIFDVGHQCYAHKILSNRKNEFSSIRLDGGISGFPDIGESQFDSFSTGHAGTSISAGLGIAFAREAKNENYRVISVVGDGSFVNGLNLEAITSSQNKPKNFLVILNDNEMSISKNVNGLYKLISYRTTKKGYINSKKTFKKLFGESFVTRGLRRVKNLVKRTLNGNSYIENFGFKYIGVEDGNNVERLIKTLTRIKESMKDKSVFLHLHTTKGKGFIKAEEKADAYHGVGKDLQIKTGAFSLQLGKTLNSIIDKNDLVTAITAGMKDGTGLSLVESVHPKNFIDVGIAEEYAVTLSAGMAVGGIRPVVCVYSTFMQRAYDEILHDVCIPNLPVVFCLDRAGLVGGDGKTHQGVFDISFLSHMPNMKIFAPSSEKEFRDILEYSLTLNCPVAIRYPNISEGCVFENESIEKFPWQEIKNGEKGYILAVGPRMLGLGKELSDKLGFSLINARQIKPLDYNMLDTFDKPVITLEENSVIGGFGSMVKSYLINKPNVKVFSFGIKDEFIKHGLIDSQLKYNELTVDDIYNAVIKKIQFNR